MFHASLLTPFWETPKYGLNFLEPPPNIIDDTPEWEVKRVLKEQTYRQWKKKQDLIRWKGYLLVYDSWINQEDMHANNLLQDFAKETPSYQSAIRARTFVVKVTADLWSGVAWDLLTKQDDGHIVKRDIPMLGTLWRSEVS